MSLAALDNLVRIGQLKAEPRNVAEVSRRPASADFSKILRAPCMPIHGPMQLMHSHTLRPVNYENSCYIIKNICSYSWNNMEATAAVLFGKTRQAVLALLFEQPEQAYYLRELARATGISPGALQHELGQLQKADLVVRSQDGNRVVYRANTAHPVFADLQSIVRKTCGLPAQIKAALDPFAAQICFATLYGSLAKGINHARSDVDLLIVGDLNLQQALAAIGPVEASIGREISVRIFSAKDFRTRREQGEHFTNSVMNGPLTPLIGSPDDA
jgi:DNA-binding transcriptional ArsR family regulator